MHKHRSYWLMLTILLSANQFCKFSIQPVSSNIDNVDFFVCLFFLFVFLRCAFRSYHM